MCRRQGVRERHGTETNKWGSERKDMVGDGFGGDVPGPPNVVATMNVVWWVHIGGRVANKQG